MEQAFIRERQQLMIESAGWRDLSSLVHLEKVCFGEDAWSLLDLVGVLTLPGAVRLKAVLPGMMAGFIAGDPHRSEGIGWITTLAVLPAYRSLGIARELLTECERRMGMRRVRLSVRCSNQAALQLYGSSGYRRVGVWEGYYTGGENALVLEKRFE